MMHPSTPATRGSILVGAAVLVAIFAIFMSGVLTYVNNESRLNYRGHQYTQSLHLAESALEIGMNELQYRFFLGAKGGTNGFYGWTSQIYGNYSNFFKVTTGFSDNFSTVFGILSTEVYYVGSTNIVIRGYGSATNTIGSLANTERKVEIVLKISPKFPVAIAAKGAIDMNGQTILTDSYDSGDPTKSTSGQYDPALKQSNGDVATNDAITNSIISVGNANIYGTVATGKSGGVTIGPGGGIGPYSGQYSTASAATAAGYLRDDYTTSFPDATLPDVAWQNGYWGHETMDTETLSISGNYKVDSIYPGNTENLIINARIVLYVPPGGVINIKGKITINSGASLTVYSGCNITMTGGGIVNTIAGSSAGNAVFYGLPTCSEVDMVGCGFFTGVIYAPEAAFKLGGTADMNGSLVAQSVKMNGGVNFHYDEALRNDPNLILGYLVSGWREMSKVSGVWQ